MPEWVIMLIWFVFGLVVIFHNLWVGIGIALCATGILVCALLGDNKEALRKTNQQFENIVSG